MEKPESRFAITLVMPALDEEANIRPALERCLEAYDRMGIQGEVLVVNDGSTDRTPELVREVARSDRRVRMIEHDRPRGIGASFRDGVAAARGEAVAMMPGDNENDPAEILRFLPLLDEVDLVVPFVFNREVRGRKRNFYSALYLAIVNLTFGQKFNYTNGTVLYRRCVLLDSPNRSDGFFFQTENLVRAARRGYLFAEVPYRLDVRETGASKAVSLKSLKRIAADYLALIGEVYGAGTPPPPAEGSVTRLRRGPETAPSPAPR
ncbi:MAG TPA: glycosyltransferase family 2 protein [bacterium]|nr:glycosyltransferase family 2 protein [bacterium]HPJ71183.1 glycosyltransferase family 2 protein [bacterium]HPQ66579.1 glycosyltransferase family 2 protein [bacterium]